MIRPIAFFLCILIAGVQTKVQCAPRNSYICSNKKPESSILVSKEADPIQQLAARELNRYLAEIAGTKLNISDKPLAAFNNQLVLGCFDTHPLLKTLITENVADKMENDGFYLKTMTSGGKNYLIIAGKTSKGVLNGVYGFIEELLKIHSGKQFVDIDFKLPRQLRQLPLPQLSIIQSPYCSTKGLELEGMGLDNKSLLNDSRREYMWKKWCGLVDWARRHKMDFISNWPYGGSSMNSFPDFIELEGYKKISSYTSEEIKKAAGYRKKFLEYASANGLDPYLMIYVPGWLSSTIAASYPEWAGKNFQDFVIRSGGNPYNWANPDVHRFMADLVAGVTNAYPEVAGIHLRVWGSESAPDAENKHRSAELIKEIIGKMVRAGNQARPDLKFILSGYTNFKDEKFEWVRKLPGTIILQRKWDEDWAVSNNPKIPANWKNVNDPIKRAVDVSIPHEEAIPFWFPSVRLFQEGIQNNVKQGETTIDGFPVNFREWDTDNCDGTLSLTAIQKLSWDPFSFNTDTFYADSYYFLFGSEVDKAITAASKIAGETLSDFLYDYGGIIEGMWPGNWFSLNALIGKGDDDKWYKAVKHITDKEGKPEDLQKLLPRLNKLLAQQERVVSLLTGVSANVKKNKELFTNMLYSNKIWQLILQSRIQAIDLVLNKADKAKTKQKLDVFIQSDEKMKYYIRQLTNFSQKAVGDYPEEIRADFLKRIQSEQDFIRNKYGHK